MRIIWFLILFTASCWLYMLSTFTPAKITLLVPFVFPLLLGIIAGTYSLRKITHFYLPLKASLFIIPLILVRIYVPYPYSFGALVIGAGLIFGLLSNKCKHFGPFSASLLLTGLILLIQGACMPIFYIVGSRFHEIAWLNHIAYPFVRIFGVNASISDGIIYLPTFINLLRFPGTLEKAGLYLLFLIVIGGIVLLILIDRDWKKIIKFFSISIGYMIIRYIVMIFIYTQLNDATLFWNPIAFTLSYLPLAFLLCIFIPLELSNRSLSYHHIIPDWTLKDLKQSLLFFVGIFCFVAIWGFSDPGERKKGRILIDEKHSNWEWTTRKFDTTWFGSQSTYNYYCMADYLNHFYHVKRNVKYQLSKKLLSGYDVLILKTPTMAYETDEIENIIEFVKQGGGLWLIGDHTNVFGMNYYLNFIAKRFGMFFHYDSTYDLSSGKLTFYQKPKIFPHPIVQNIPFFLFATSCTVDAGMMAENVMLGYGLRSRLLSYSDKSFFERKPTSDYEFGLFLQGAGVKYGKGRAATFTDSTCFSNFYMFIPGKPELAMGYVEWLNRKNKYHFLPYVFAVIAFVFLFIGFYKRREETGKTLIIFLFSSLCAVSIGIIFFSWLSYKTYTFPDSHTNFRKICFETEYSKIVLPVKKLVDNHPDNYHTFYVWTQRMGYVPSLEKKLELALKKGDLVVITNPVKSFNEDIILKVIDFVENGGRLLVIDGPQNKRSSSNQLLRDFQMEINFSEIQKSKLYNKNNDLMGTAIKTGIVKGGIPFLLTSDKKSIFSVTQKGKGQIGVVADSYVFSNNQMGGTQIVPNAHQRKIYNLEFFILNVLGKSN